MDAILSFFRPGPETVLHSPHSPQECATRLTAAIDSPMIMLGSKPAVGVASPLSAQIKKRLGYRNSFQQNMVIAITPDGAGARLSCRSSAPALGQLFIVGWFTIALLMAVIMLSNVAQGFLSPVFLIVPVLVALFGWGMAMLGKNMSNADEPFLLDFLRRTLDAR
jgi:hypothetical protein